MAVTGPNPPHEDPAQAAPSAPAPLPAIRSVFGGLLGALSRQRSGDGEVYGLVVDERLTNEAGVMHGGAITALLDEVIGSFVHDTRGGAHVTVQSSTVFLRPAKVGDVVEIAQEIVEATRSMTFVEGRLIVRGAVIARSQMIFKARRTGNREG